MFIKITESGGRRYAKLAEAYRDERGIGRQRIIANLGRVDALQSSASALGNGLKKLCLGPKALDPVTADFECALSVGATWLLHSLWNQLGFSEVFRPTLEKLHPGFDAEALLRVMVFNRLCDAESKLGILRWLEATLIPGVPQSEVTHQRLLRTMDSIEEARDALDERLAEQLRPLLDQELSIVFYDLTTLRAEGTSKEEDDFRQFGISKDGGIRRQCLLGVVQTAEGLPIYHEVFNGNKAETKTLLPTFRKVLKRYRIQRLILVADRGLLSLDNLEELLETRLEDGAPLEFILAVPGRRYNDFEALLTPWHETDCVPAKEEIIREFEWQGQRLIVAHDPRQAAESGASRDERVRELTELGVQLASKLDGQDEGKKHRGRKLSDGGATAKFYSAVKDERLSKIMKVDLTSEVFTYDLKDDALQRERLMDGKLLLITNAQDMTPAEVVARYKSLADIERGFRVLKNELDIVPMHHRLPKRIKSHAMLCFLALIMHRILRMRLQDKNSKLSPERVLEIAGRIQWHEASLQGGKKLKGISRLSPQQMDLFETIDVPVPGEKEVEPAL